MIALISASFLLAGPTFSVTYSEATFSAAFNGRVVVYLSKTGGEPRFGPNWLRPQPCYSAVLRCDGPGKAMVLNDANSIGFPGRLSALEPGEYTVQAVVDRNLGGRQIGNSPGNLYSVAQKVTIQADSNIEVVCDKVVPAREFKDSKNVKEARIESKLLSAHYKRQTHMTAAVVLPDLWFTDTSRKFPVIYSIPGFGGTHYGLSGRESTRGTLRDGEPFIFVALNPDCPTGHSVFADSANNGPWGKALTTELIPFIERTYRAIGQPEARFTTGHSSGGWSSLWLQVAYPDFFGGCWSTAPDPVDFRDFQRINIYRKGENMFTDPEGNRRPIARRGDTPSIWYKDFSDMERPIRGEQLGSFDGVFSPKGANGEPVPLWDRVTGAIDPKVAVHWKKYDIGLILRENAKALAPKLKGKIHVYMGDKDTFYLEGATMLLRDDIAKLPYDAKVEIHPGDHGSVMTSTLTQRIDKEMAAQFRRNVRQKVGGGG